MPRLSPATKELRRAQIASAALRCIARQGFADTSMADIIAESGLSAGSIYSHYASKIEIVHTVASDVLRLKSSRLPGGDGSIVAPDQLAVALLGEEIDAEFARVLLQVWAEVARDEELAGVAQENLGALRGTIAVRLAPWIDARAAETGEPRDAVEASSVDAVMTCAQGYIMRLAVDRAVDPRALRATLVGLLGTM